MPVIRDMDPSTPKLFASIPVHMHTKAERDGRQSLDLIPGAAPYNGGVDVYARVVFRKTATTFGIHLSPVSLSNQQDLQPLLDVTARYLAQNTAWNTRFNLRIDEAVQLAPADAHDVGERILDMGISTLVRYGRFLVDYPASSVPHIASRMQRAKWLPIEPCPVADAAMWVDHPLGRLPRATELGTFITMRQLLPSSSVLAEAVTAFPIFAQPRRRVLRWKTATEAKLYGDLTAIRGPSIISSSDRLEQLRFVSDTNDSDDEGLVAVVLMLALIGIEVKESAQPNGASAGTVARAFRKAARFIDDRRPYECVTTPVD